MTEGNRTRQVVLGFLTWEPMSGYDIKQVIEETVSNFWSESYGQIYPALRALVRDGLAKRSRTEVTGGRRRQLYAITPKGRAALRRWLKEPVAPRPPRNELLLKLFFARHIGGDAAKGHVETFKHHLEAIAQHYQAISAELGGTDEPDAPYWRLTLEYGQLRIAAHLEWCDKAIAALKRIDRAEKTSRKRSTKS